VIVFFPSPENSYRFLAVVLIFEQSGGMADVNAVTQAFADGPANDTQEKYRKRQRGSE